ncbi:MAG: tetratricopeptide repeat protein [Verrucomicrobia bacterium]|nr:tetratricopeptide repeat protein [Verrucomicrobiota bacterium]
MSLKERAPCVVVLLLCLFAQNLFAASTAEERRAFDAAAKAFQDGVLGYERAEREFGEFVKNFPAAERRSEAILLQARSRFYMTNSGGAVELLTANLPQTGKLADEYQFWLGEAQFQGGQFAPAAEAYAKLVNTFTNSSHVLAASYSEALCRSKLGELQKVVELLQPPTGAFQRAAKARSRDEWVPRGGLLLAETLLDSKKFKEGEAALNALDTAKLSADLAWRRQYVACRLQQADGRDELALTNTTPLLALAKAAKDSRYQAESVVLRGGILAKLGRYDDAIAAYSANLTTNVPPEFRRQALLKNIELTFAQNKVTDTVRMLEEFSAQNPTDPALDLAQATLGELRLKEHFALVDAATNAPLPAATNFLQMAFTNATRVITGFTNSPYLGRAHYTRGWVLWNEGRKAESAPDFRVAAERLPKSEEQAIARYKLAEAQLLQKDYTNAIANLTRILVDFADFERVKSTLFDQALYKIVRAAIAAGNLKVAEDAARKILLWYPESFFSDRSLLLIGQAFNHRGEPAEARVLFQDLLTHFPDSALGPEANLAIARTYKQEHDWARAAAKLNEWVVLYKTNAALPNVEFERASLTYQAGDVTNAVRQFTNFVARFPAHTNAPLAQMWLGNFFFNQEAFDVAEANYQRVFQNTNWQSGTLPFEARLAAGRAAFLRQGRHENS